MPKHFDHWKGFIEALDAETVWIRMTKIDSSRKTSIGEESRMECSITALSNINVFEGLCLDIYADTKDVVIKTLPKTPVTHSYELRDIIDDLFKD